MKLGIYVHINVGTLMSIRRGHGLHRNSMEKQGSYISVLVEIQDLK
jgi:hypothetical protein